MYLIRGSEAVSEHSTTRLSIGTGTDDVQVRYAIFNQSDAELVERALRGREANLTNEGVLYVSTGKHTGRSPRDKYIVNSPSISDDIWWDANNSLSVDAFDRLHEDITAHLESATVHTQDLLARIGAKKSIRVRMITSLAWHALFIRNLLLQSPGEFRPEAQPDLTIINIPEFRADPVRHECRSETLIAMNLERSLIIIVGSYYGGENKKSVFSYLNHKLPASGVLPMHCSACHLKDNQEKSVLFFGLSGTGKTTLSTDPAMVLVGDDEHGWADDGIFNIEAGCYAKVNDLSPVNEAEIYRATNKFGTIIENVVVDPVTRIPDFGDTTLTENTRSAYGISKITFSAHSGCAGHPENIFLLTCDAYGVLPPIAKLYPEQSLHYFLAGFTSKIAGTERGVIEPIPVFSECFGRPFLPRSPVDYGKLFMERLHQHGTSCWLLNTGWSGGSYGTGSRIQLGHTRALVHAVLSGELMASEFCTEPIFGLSIPTSVKNVPSRILNPRYTWEDTASYDESARVLQGKIQDKSAIYADLCGVKG